HHSKRRADQEQGFGDSHAGQSRSCPCLAADAVPRSKMHNRTAWKSAMVALRPLPEPRMSRPPLPPFTAETAAIKVRKAEDAWNSRDPEAVSLAYTEDSRWRNRAEFLHGRREIVAFLTRKWARELDYRLIKEIWAFTGNRIAVRFAYEWHDDSGQHYRSYGNE